MAHGRGSVERTAVGCARTMWALLAALCTTLGSRAHTADIFNEDAVGIFVHPDRSLGAVGNYSRSNEGCVYKGVWYDTGAEVPGGGPEPCLRCACGRGALVCRRRACAPPPRPPPRCHLRHRKGACCPELHCPDGVTVMELSASARLEDDTDIAFPATPAHGCVVGGTLYAAGSALGARAACEQCFCLGGARRCVRPRCLPPPPGCRARPAPGACCPPRYYCDHSHTTHRTTDHDCEVDGKWIPEGERVVSAEQGMNCTQCFCLKGSVRCQPLACAPPLLGCEPLLRPMECCPHQYNCKHQQLGLNNLLSITNNALHLTRYDDRSFHTKPSNLHESTTRAALTKQVTERNRLVSVSTKKHVAATTKVKRKTNDLPDTTLSQKLVGNTSTTQITTIKLPDTKSTIVPSFDNVSTTEELQDQTIPTEQPEQIVRIMINGTINCTTELSSTSLPLNSSLNDTLKILLEAQPRVPLINTMDIEAQTFNPNDIITQKYEDFNENETFTINVTSSLNTNTSQSTSGPMTVVAKTSLATDAPEALNISKKTKGDDDYDYTEPTLPPSLPNLKIIPFVAADAVVNENVAPKETLTYPVLEREDKFPVYYPNIPKDIPMATRRQDLYPTKYPVFSAEKTKLPYPSKSERPSAVYPGNNDLAEYTVTALLGNRVPEHNKATTKTTIASTLFEIKTPTVNLFSPPAETEGGFVPKAPGIINEYFAVYPSTAPPPSVPHLTTSMQLDTNKGECISADGRRVPEGDSITLACSVCTCVWAEMHCSPRPCHVPLGCKRLPVTNDSKDLCCGQLICNQNTKDNAMQTPKVESEERVESFTDNNKTLSNDTKVPTKVGIQTHVDNISKISESNTTPTIITSTINILDITNTKKYTVSNDVSSEEESNIRTNKTLTSSEPPVTTTLKLSSTTTSTPETSPALTVHKEVNETSNHSLEYEDEEEDEGFSLDSVLKLFLDGYDTTTTSPYKKKTTTIATTPVTMRTTIKPVTSTKRFNTKVTVVPFIPMPPRYPHTPPKQLPPQTTVNRIDHLVLGEATAIKKTTIRPTSISFRPITTPSKPITFERIKPIPEKLTTTSRPIEATNKSESSNHYTSGQQNFPRPSSTGALPGMGGGILKLAGCNIYGRMYRVGRIITELSTPCQECRCTELGVQCRPLVCSQEP